MQEKEKMYTLALMALVMTGISAAWAAYSNFATITMGAAEDLAEVYGSTLDWSSKKIYRKGWFHFTRTNAFTIKDPTTNKMYVRVALVNPAQLKEYYGSLIIYVKLYDTNGDEYVEDIITLTQPEVILDPRSPGDDLDTDNDWKIDVTVNGFVLKKTSDLPDIKLYCSVEPAEASH